MKKKVISLKKETKNFFYKKLFSIFLLVGLSSCSLNQQIEKTGSHPLTDNTNVEVYDFIVDHVQKSSNLSRKQASSVNEENERIAQQIANGKILKPPIASIYEAPMSYVLNIFCHHSLKCRSLGLYARNGQLIAAASQGQNNEPDLIIDDVLYQKYQTGSLTKPHINLGKCLTIFPIYLAPENREWGYGRHTSPAPSKKPIGFISYKED